MERDHASVRVDQDGRTDPRTTGRLLGRHQRKRLTFHGTSAFQDAKAAQCRLRPKPTFQGPSELTIIPSRFK